MSERTLHDVKIGDLVGPVDRRGHWTGALFRVAKVADKRFMIHGDWIDKATGLQVGRHSHYSHVIATPAMIASQTAREEADAKRNAFHARDDYKHASAILFLLGEMNPDNHPLDKLTPAEWAEFRRKLGA